MTETTATAKPRKHDCACQRFGSACGGDTWNVFSPGHDARIKGLLQRAHRAGEKVQFDGKPMTATAAAMKVSPVLHKWLDAPTKSA
jgi:hypothetical protein